MKMLDVVYDEYYYGKIPEPENYNKETTTIDVVNSVLHVSDIIKQYTIVLMRTYKVLEQVYKLKTVIGDSFSTIKNDKEFIEKITQIAKYLDIYIKYTTGRDLMWTNDDISKHSVSFYVELPSRVRQAVVNIHINGNREEHIKLIDAEFSSYTLSESSENVKISFNETRNKFIIGRQSTSKKCDILSLYDLRDDSSAIFNYELLNANDIETPIINNMPLFDDITYKFDKIIFEPEITSALKYAISLYNSMYICVHTKLLPILVMDTVFVYSKNKCVKLVDCDEYKELMMETDDYIKNPIGNYKGYPIFDMEVTK